MDQDLKALQARLIPTFLWATLAAVVFIAAAYVWVVFGQHVEVVTTADGAFIDVMWIGEYQSNVQEIRITEVASGKVLWCLKAANGQSFPLWRVFLRNGKNVAMPDSVMGAEVVSPLTETWELVPTVKCRVNLWTVKDFGIRRHVSTTFMLAEGQGA